MPNVKAGMRERDDEVAGCGDEIGLHIKDMSIY